MMKKIIFYFLALSILFVGCGAKKVKRHSEKEINLYFSVNIKTLDPIYADDLYSATLIGSIYQTLYQYHYLKRPYTLIPYVARSMPEISDDGLTYTIKLRKGIYFQDDKCFPNGKGRELKADDVIYSFKRLADIKNRSTGWWIFNNRIVGLNEFREKSNSKEPTDYSMSVEGLKKLDDYTIQIKLTKPFPQFKYLLAMSFTAIVPKEAVEYYKEEFSRHPVGTGPYMLKEWLPNNKIVLVRNPDYWDEYYPSEGMPEDVKNGLLADAGKKLPFLDKVNYFIYKEANTLWLNFLKGNIDMCGIPMEYFSTVIDENGNLREEFVKRGIILTKEPSLDLTYIGFNMEDPVVGKNKYLRLAIAYAYDVNYVIKYLYNNRAIRAKGPIPPGIFGYRKDIKNPWVEYNVEKAKEYLKKAGYPDGKGAPTLYYDCAGNSAISRKFSDFFVQSMNKIGLKVVVRNTTFPEFLDKLKNKKVQIFGGAWAADYPDPENFLQLFYGPNESPGSNAFNYKNKKYDELYEKMAVMPNGKERQKVIDQMVNILIEDIPCIFCTHRVAYGLRYPWVKNYKRNEMASGTVKYLKIDYDNK